MTSKITLCGGRMKEQIFKENTQQIANRLKTIIDRLRLKSHLANMESKQSIEALNRSMTKLEGDIRHLKFEVIQSKDHTNLTFHLGLMEARQRWGEILEFLRPVTREMQNMNATLDHAKVQAHLAMMESKDAYEERKKKLMQVYKNRLAPSFEQLFKSFKNELDEFDKHLSQ